MNNTNAALNILTMPEPSSPITDCDSYFESSRRVLAQLPYSDIERVADKLYQAYEEGRRVFLFGNGGSAALASHFACDLGKGTTVPGNHQKRFKVLSLTDNVALLTAWANDTSYEQIFAQQLQNFIESDDIAFGISGSGRSPNILLALQAARKAGAFNVGLTGFQGGGMKGLCDLCIVIPSDNMQVIEDFQLAVTHALFTIVRNKIIFGNRVIR